MDNTEFSTPFSTNFFTEFSSEFSGFTPSNVELTPVTGDVSIPDITPSEPMDEKSSFDKDYEDFIKSDKLKQINDEYKNMGRKLEEWHNKNKEKEEEIWHKNKEEEEIIKQHKAKYKEYIDEYIAQKNSASIECNLSISRFPRVDTAFDLLHMPLTAKSEQLANEIGCVIRNQTLYPVNWTKEEVDELNRRMRS